MTTPHETPNPLDAAIQSGANHDVPPEILNRARRHLDVLRERMETRQMERNEQRGMFGLRAHWGRMLAFATPVAALLLAGLVFWCSTGNGGAAAYASAVHRLRTAENMAITLITRLKGMPEQRMELTYNNKGDMRFDTGKGIYSILDMSQKKVLTIDSEHKQATEISMSNLPAATMKAQTDCIERLRHMPEKASKTLGQKLIDHHLVNGFQVNENGATSDIWIDAGTHELVQIDMQYEKMPGLSATMTNFRFNIPLAAGFFSTAIPSGFKKDAMNFDMGAPVDEDIATLLETFSAFSPDGTFPASLNPAELTQSVQTFMKSHPDAMGDKAIPNHPYFQKHKSMKKEDVVRESQRTARAMVFIMQAKPENDWHYAGKGVKFGDAQTPIAWWKPTGQKNYKVIFGDLSVKDVPPEDIPSAPGYQKTLPQPK